MVLRILGSLYSGRMTCMAASIGRMRSVDLGTVCFRPLPACLSWLLGAGRRSKLAGMQNLLDLS